MTQDNEPLDLSGRDIALYMETGDERVLVKSSVNINEVSFTFYGKDQHSLGVYRLVLVENDGSEGMRTIDTCRAFSLVGCSCESDNEKPGGDIEDVTIEKSTVLIVGIPGENGLSAYAEWLKLGNEGTEEDFMNWLRSPATEAAGIAADAAQKAIAATEAAQKASERTESVSENADAAESRRTKSEEDRQIAEASREESESERDASEYLRKENETSRIAAEQKRASAESARENAEQEREKKFSELSAASASATDAANAAADEARKAASVRFEINMETGEVYAITEE